MTIVLRIVHCIKQGMTLRAAYKLARLLEDIDTLKHRD